LQNNWIQVYNKIVHVDVIINDHIIAIVKIMYVQFHIKCMQPWNWLSARSQISCYINKTDLYLTFKHVKKDLSWTLGLLEYFIYIYNIFLTTLKMVFLTISVVSVNRSSGL